MQLGEPSKHRGDDSFIAIEVADIFEFPADGVWLEIEHEDGTLFAVRTDGRGHARIQNVPAGDYWVRPLILPRTAAPLQRSTTIRG